MKKSLFKGGMLPANRVVCCISTYHPVGWYWWYVGWYVKTTTYHPVNPFKINTLIYIGWYWWYVVLLKVKSRGEGENRQPEVVQSLYLRSYTGMLWNYIPPYHPKTTL